ncbi:hypothetical protein CI610_03208 [invertebrate metagenome]|uniref:Uncharacterized protein n=1 Tax=invertebrate metagenome TaxID=1711999 RepID=A0A2H9T3Q9_9ZZZZ
MTHRLFSRAGLLILALVVLLLTIGISQVLKNARLDLTEDKLYTLTDGTKNLLKSLDGKAVLQLFYSESQTGEMPFIRNYARRVTELLEEYVIVSGGKLSMEVIDPEPFSENEDKASSYGLQAVPLGNGSKEIYFGLVITSTPEDDNKASDNKEEDGGNVKREVISFLHPDKERFLEYDISKLVYAVTQKEKPKIGLMSSLQVNGGFDMMSRQSSGPWVSISQLEKNYDISNLDMSVQEIPSNLKLLILIHPKKLSEQTLYAIDQFVLGGGHALVFVDPVAESDNAGGMGMMGMGGDKSSTLGPVFEAWGIDYDPKKVVLDARYALQVGSPSGRPVRHLGILGFSEESFNKEDVATSNLQKVNIASAGALLKRENNSTQWDVLLHSSNNAMLTSAESFEFLMDPSSLFKGFQPTGELYVIAARLSGDVATAFPEGKPKEKEAEKSSDDNKADSKKTADDKKEIASGQTRKADKEADKEIKNKKEEMIVSHIARSVRPINVIVVADTDMLTDRLWVQKTSFFGQQIVQPFANNGDMLINMTDNLLGNKDLISIRSRGQFSRPFDKVNALEQEAEASFHKKEEELKERLSATESKIRELQTKKEGEEKLVLSTEQEQEVEKFMKEKLKIRKELRDVQHQLGKDIERLGTQLKLANILFIPLLLTIFALGFRVYKRKKHKR